MRRARHVPVADTALRRCDGDLYTHFRSIRWSVGWGGVVTNVATSLPQPLDSQCHALFCIANGSIPSVAQASFTMQVAASVLRTATRPVMEREACFIDNEDLWQLGTASARLYKVVSIALTMWAIWDPTVVQWVGSPMVLDRLFAADCPEECQE